jgi:TRAP-type C4-dicarboxylate transport system permease small subunit
LRAIEFLARLCAILAGLLLTAVTLITCVSLLGRNTLGMTLAGDFEMTGLVAGAAVALFLPLCQLERGNIIVDFFTAKAGDAANRVLDRIGALIFGLIMATLAWRTTVGGLSAFRSHSGTMILDLPEWVTYAAMVPPLALTALIALNQAVTGKFGAQPA